MNAASLRVLIGAAFLVLVVTIVYFTATRTPTCTTNNHWVRACAETRPAADCVEEWKTYFKPEGCP